MIRNFLKGIRKYAVFTGRSRRSEFWYFTLFCCIVGWALLLLSQLVFRTAPEDIFLAEKSLNIFIILYFLFVAFLIIPTIAVSVRRLHDIGKSGWWYFLVFVPVVGPIILIVWFARDSQPGTNRWGENPKGVNMPGTTPNTPPNTPPLAN